MVREWNFARKYSRILMYYLSRRYANMNYYINSKIGSFLILNQKRENDITFLYCKCIKCGKEKWIRQGDVKKQKCCSRKHSNTEFKATDYTNQIINNITFLEKTDIRKRRCSRLEVQMLLWKPFLLSRIQNKKWRNI